MHIRILVYKIGGRAMSNTPTEVSINRHSNLLEKDPYNYELQDVKQPNLLREFFEYTEIPKVCFNFKDSD